MSVDATDVGADEDVGGEIAVVVGNAHLAENLANGVPERGLVDTDRVGLFDLELL